MMWLVHAALKASLSKHLLAERNLKQYNKENVFHRSIDTSTRIIKRGQVPGLVNAHRRLETFIQFKNAFIQLLHLAT